MIEQDLIEPANLVMAGLAVLAFLTLVNVVCRVAAVTILGQGNFEYRFDVTGLTRCVAVRAGEYESGVSGMIEGCRLPFLIAVTGFAVGPEVAVVRVVLLVTGNAGSLESVRKRIVAVAAGAVEIGMATRQSEQRVAIVIEGGVRPINCVVATVALVTTAPVMRIIFLVATHAGGRRILECRVGVTIETACTRVGA